MDLKIRNYSENRVAYAGGGRTFKISYAKQHVCADPRVTEKSGVAANQRVYIILDTFRLLERAALSESYLRMTITPQVIRRGCPYYI